MATETLSISINEKGSLQVARKIGAIDKQAKKTHKSVSLLKKGLGAFAAIGLGIAITRSVKLLADFSQTMSTVKAITGATNEEFQKLRDTAKELGERTRFSAKEVGEGMLFLARAGFGASGALESIEDTLRLAQSGALELGTAADIASNILKGFQGDTSQLARTVDVLAKAANSSNTNIAQLGQAMKFVAPVAAGFGISLEEATAAAGTLSDAGLQASMAGTGLRKVLTNLQSPTTKELKILKELGLTADDVKVTTHGLAGALTTLKVAGIDATQAMELFGDRGGPAANVLLESIPRIKEFTSELDNAAGTAKRVSEIMDDNLNGSLLRVRSAFQSVIIEIGDLGAESGITTFMEGLANALRFVARNLDTIARVLAVVSVALGVVFAKTAVVAAIGAVKALSLQFVKLWALMLANPFVAMATIIVAAITAIVVFRDQISVLGDGFVTLGDIGTAALKRLRDNFSIFSESAKDDLEEVEEQSSNGMQNTVLFMLSMLQAALQVIDKIAGTIIGTIRGAFLTVKFLTTDTKNKTIGDLKEAGEIFKGAFLEGFNQSVLEDEFLAVFDDAEKIATERAQKAVRELKGRSAIEEQGGGTIDIPTIDPPDLPKAEFAELIRLLKQEGELLQVSNQEREIREAIISAEEQLERKLNVAEVAVVASLTEQNQKFVEQRAILDEIKGPQLTHNRNVAALNALLSTGQINQDEYNTKLLELNDNLNKVAEDGIVTFGEAWSKTWRDATNQLIDFVGNSKNGWKDLVNSILQQIQRLAAQQAVLLTLRTLGVNLNPGVGGSGTPGKALGGSFFIGGQGGIDSQPVNFMGTPGEKVTVTPAGRAADEGGGSGIHTVNIYNVNSEDEIPAETDGEQNVLNIIRRNKNGVNQILA